MEAVLRHDGSFNRLTDFGRLGILTDVVTALAPAAVSEIDDVARCIFPEFDSYGELIAATDFNGTVVPRVVVFREPQEIAEQNVRMIAIEQPCPQVDLPGEAPARAIVAA